MPARTLNDFLAGFFCGENEALGEVKMTERSYQGDGKADMKRIKVEGKGDKEREVTVRHISPRWEGKSTWHWEEGFTREWSKTYLTSNRKRTLK